MRDDNAATMTPPSVRPSARLRIGVRAQGFLEWTGGTAFLCGVMRGLQDSLPESEIHLLVADRGPKAAIIQTLTTVINIGNRLRGAPRVGVDRTNLVAAESAVAHVDHVDLGVPALARAAKRLGLDIIIPSIGELPANFQPPWVGYIYDFQHLQLPHFFSSQVRQLRDQSFQEIITNSHAIIANSRDTARIAIELYGASEMKMHALPFCACPDPAWFHADASDLPWLPQQPYFIISNQFWIHKDHETAFRALALLPPHHRNVAIVCTGNTTDSRHPDYFSGLMSLVDRLGLSSRVHVMGLLPKISQIGLMRRSVAVVQPTLCEGGPGGGAAYDAVALGVPAILSDISINREIADEREVSFFQAQDPESLAVAMTRILDQSFQRDSPDALLARGAARWRRYCDAMRLVVLQTTTARG
jgi:glycosyltransferase involved in cell wall biosynthesis